MRKTAIERHTRQREPAKRRAFLLTIVLAAVLTACGGGSGRGEPFEIKARPVHLDPDRPSVERVGQLRYRGGLRLTSRARHFGGLSGLTFIAHDKLLAVSDQGWWVSFDIVEKDGRLVDVGNATIDPLRDMQGARIKPKSNRDAEAVEFAADGSLMVAFERRHRLWRYPAPPAHTGGQIEQLPMLPAWADLPVNGGFEAIAVGPGTRRLLVSEHGQNGVSKLAGWLFERGRYRRLTYATVGQFVPTDFAQLRSGDLVALERRFTAVGGFASRLQIIDRQTIRPSANLTGREIARLERPLLIENFEGVAVRQTAGRPTRIYIVSDDNYNPFQQTLLLAFELIE